MDIYSTIDPWLKVLQNTELATAIREEDVFFPWIESVHVLALVVVVGSIAILDLRLLGKKLMDRPVVDLISNLLPITWIAFMIAAVSGGLLFSSKAIIYIHNNYFLLKIVFLMLAACNMLYFHFFTQRNVYTWGRAHAIPPKSAVIAGILSLCLWAFIVGFGRWIGFTT